MNIKEFLDGRSCCPLCNSNLEIKIVSNQLDSLKINLTDNILNINGSLFCNYNIDTVKNIIIKGKDSSRWNFHLSLFCPNCLDYIYTMSFDIKNGNIDDAHFLNEVLIIDNFALSYINISYGNINLILNYTDFKTGTITYIPYFDYRNMSISKLKDKIKTYLLFQ